MPEIIEVNVAVKQIIVFRKDLLKGEKAIRKGKFATQVAHASLEALLTTFHKKYDGADDAYTLKFEGDNFSPVSQWLKGGYKKVVVSVENEEELMKLYNSIEGLPKALITDNGLTEFKGVKTVTCFAVGPAYTVDIDKYTEGLPLL